TTPSWRRNAASPRQGSHMRLSFWTGAEGVSFALAWLAAIATPAPRRARTATPARMTFLETMWLTRGPCAPGRDSPRPTCGPRGARGSPESRPLLLGYNKAYPGPSRAPGHARPGPARRPRAPRGLRRAQARARPGQRHQRDRGGPHGLQPQQRHGPPGGDPERDPGREPRPRPLEGARADRPPGRGGRGGPLRRPRRRGPLPRAGARRAPG